MDWSGVDYQIFIFGLNLSKKNHTTQVTAELKFILVT